MTIATILFFTHALCLNYQQAQVRDRSERSTVSVKTETTTVISLDGAWIGLTCNGKTYTAWMPKEVYDETLGF